MSFAPPDSISLLFFDLTLLIVIAATVRGVFVANTNVGERTSRAIWVALGLAIWLLMLSFIVNSGALAEAPMPRIMLFFGVSNIAGVLFGLSSIGKCLAQGLSIQALVAFQVFRLPLELVLHSWASQGTIPTSMTWTGSNFDIASGCLALILFPFVGRSLALAWSFNLIGFLLLLNVGRIAIMSSPLPFAWNVSPPLQLVFHLPYALIVPVCVAGALMGHIVLTRALLFRLK